MSDVAAAPAPAAPTSTPNPTPTPRAASATPAPAATQPPNGTPPPEAEDDGFELEGKKLTKAEVRAAWDTIKANYGKGKNSAQLLRKADERLAKAAEAEKRATEVRELFKSKDPVRIRKTLEDWGLDPDDFGSTVLMPSIQKQGMSEPERALYEREQALAQKEARIKAAEEAERAKHEEAEVTRWRETYGQQMKAAFAKTGLPEGAMPMAQQRMAAHWERYIELTGQDPSPEELSALVMDDYRGELKSLTDSLSGEQIVQWLGEAAVKKLRAYDLARFKAKRTPGAPPERNESAPPPMNGARPKGPLTPDEANKLLQERLRAFGEVEP